MADLIVCDAYITLPALPDGAVDAIITDPPYDLTREEQWFFLREFFRVARGDVLVFCDPMNLWPGPTQWLFWVKPLSTKNTSRRYASFVEMIAVYKRSDVWNTGFFANYGNVFHDVLEPLPRAHAHQKPVALMERLVRIHTLPGDLVLDPFCGSGPTLRACDQAGRRGIGFDIDPEPYQLAELDRRPL